MVQTVDPAHGIDQKTCNIRAIVAHNGGRGAVGARESLTTVGDYAIFHWVRSRLGAGLPRSPQNSAGPKGSQTLELFRSSPGMGSADRLARDRDQQGKQPVSAQVPGRQCQTKGRGCAQLIVRLKPSPAGGGAEEAILGPDR